MCCHTPGLNAQVVGCTSVKLHGKGASGRKSICFAVPTYIWQLHCTTVPLHWIPADPWLPFDRCAAVQLGVPGSAWQPLLSTDPAVSCTPSGSCAHTDARNSTHPDRGEQRERERMRGVWHKRANNDMCRGYITTRHACVDVHRGTRESMLQGRESFARHLAAHLRIIRAASIAEGSL